MSFFSRISFLIGKRVILIRIGGELGIKSRRTRRRMLSQLKQNIKSFLVQYESFEIVEFRDRIIVYSRSKENLEILARLVSTSISGISSVSPALVVESNENDIIFAGMLEAEAILQPNSSFRVTARREGNHPFSSMQIAGKLGEKILTTHIEDIRVDLKSPDNQIYLDVRGPITFVYSKIYPGIDGIPSHAQGTAIALIRPNFNSIFAAWLMKKRGVEILPVFFKTGKPSEHDFQKWIHQEFVKPLKIIPFKSILYSYKDELSLCLICQALSEHICQNIAIESNINILSSPTCFNFNDESMSLEALKILEKKSTLSIIRPIQMGYFSEERFELPLDKNPCCTFRSQVSLQVTDNFWSVNFDELSLNIGSFN